MTWTDKYHRDGYVIFEALVPADAIDIHVAALTGLLDSYNCGHNRSLHHLDGKTKAELSRKLNELEYSETQSLPLSLSEPLQEKIGQIFGNKPILSNTRSSLWEAGDRAPHFDTSMLSTTPFHHVCRSWCALDDIDAGSGTFYVIPGTHKKLPDEVCRAILEQPHVCERFSQLENLYKECDGNVDSLSQSPIWKDFHSTVWPMICDSVVQKIQNAPRKAFPLRKGDVVLFNPRIVHGTMPRTDLRLPRKSKISEWRSPDSTIYFATEYFGPTRDGRNKPNSGRFAALGAVNTSWGAYIPPNGTV